MTDKEKLLIALAVTALSPLLLVFGSKIQQEMLKEESEKEQRRKRWDEQSKKAEIDFNEYYQTTKTGESK